MNNLLFSVVRNVMTGAGFEGGAYGSEWIHAWISLGIIGIAIFLVIMAQRNDMLPIPFHIGGGLIGFFVAILIITFTGASKLALGVGLIVAAGGGYLVGSRFE